MTTVNIHEAKTQLSKLIAAVSDGETVVIARAGRPVARLSRVDSEEQPSRLGFFAGQASIPADFDEMLEDEIASLFVVENP